MGDSITEGTIVDLPVSVGSYVDADEVVVVLETDKVSVDVRSPEAGQIKELLGKIDEVVQVGSPLFHIDTDAAKVADPSVAAHAAGGPSKILPVEEEVPAPPVAAAPAATLSHPKLSLTEQPPPPASTPPDAKPSQPVDDYLAKAMANRTETRTKMSRMRQRIATRLKEAQETTAMLTTFQEVDMGNLMEMRAKYKDEFQLKHGVKLGFMSAFVKASTKALLEIPAINAYIDDNTKEVVYHNYCDISVAVASPNGLVVPVLRNTESMSFADVEQEIANYSNKAKAGTLAIEDMAGGTFTISNGGVYGSLMGTPIINLPQSAILGMHATKMRPVVINVSRISFFFLFAHFHTGMELSNVTKFLWYWNTLFFPPSLQGAIVARPMMYLALTYDHRLVDGREAVTFLKSIADKIADPARLLLDI
jgi:2-oxoglutarate dehydrogenase E2 component (dihydrolipoamide succinyltransferase)